MDKNYDWSESESSSDWSESESSSDWSEDETPTESDIEFIDDSELSEDNWSEEEYEDRT